MSKGKKSFVVPEKKYLPSSPITPKRKSLGGSVFIHNALEFDYCIKECLHSLCAICDEVVVLDAKSTDGTLDYLQEIKKGLSNLSIVEGVIWECANNYDRLTRLANLAKSYLHTDWHFMLQADEVIHETSFKFIKQILEEEKNDAYFVRRFNFFGDYNHYIKIDQPTENKPCSDQIIRLATIDKVACGDAESLLKEYHLAGTEYIDEIKVFHYGFVRNDAKFIKKVLDMQSWFWGPDSIPDQRVAEMDKKGDQIFDWTVMKTREMLTRYEGTHPLYAQRYVEDRQVRKPIPINDTTC